MTKLERELLIKARERIARGADQFVCIALMNASSGSGPQERAVTRLCGYICSQIGPAFTLDTWARRQKLHSLEGVPYKVRKAVRLAWIGWMLGSDKFPGVAWQ